MKTLFTYLKRYRKESILGPLFKLLEATLELIVPLIVAMIIDRGIPSSDTPFIVKACIGLVLLGLVGLAFSLTAQYFAAKAAVGCVRDLRGALFSHITTLSYGDVDRIGASTLITRMSADAKQVQTGVNLALRLLLRSPFVVFGAMLMAFLVDASAAVTFTVLIPALAVAVFGIMLLSMPLYRRVQGHLDRVLLSVRENVSGARVVRAYGKEDEEARAFSEQHARLTRAEQRVGRLSALLNPLTYVLVNLATVWLLSIGAVRVNLGTLSVGQVVALFNYMSQILVELIKLADLIVSITRSVACAGRIEAVMLTQSSLPVTDGTLPAPIDGAPFIEFQGVSMRYPSAAEDSLSDISFTVERGETVGIIGGTGSGKSSLVNLLPRFYDVAKGEIRIEGHRIDTLPVAAHRARIGIVPQKAVLFRGTVRENLAWGAPEASDAAMEEALLAAQILESINEKGGLSLAVQQGGTNLSGGQRQRLTIARALVRRPDVLILDDASSALDYKTDADLRAAIRSLPYSPTVFIVSQRTVSLMHADRILVLDEGELVGCGTHEELLSSCDVYREIHESQFACAKGGERA